MDKLSEHQTNLNRLTDIDIKKADHTVRMLEKGIYDVLMFQEKQENRDKTYKCELGKVFDK